MMAENRIIAANEEVLEHLGLSKNEGRVYLTLLEVGNSNVGKIAEKSKLYRPNIYDALERLKRKGLVNYVSMDNKKTYQAAEPEHLLNILKQKETLLQGILPQLQLNHKLANQKVEVQVFEGVPAIRNITRRFVEQKDDEIFCFGIPKMVVDLNGSAFHNALHEKRIAKKQVFWHIYNSDGVERVQYLKTLPYTKVRIFEHNYPVNTRICGDEVCIILYSSDPPISVVIKNMQMADAYRQYFWLLWDQAKEP